MGFQIIVQSDISYISHRVVLRSMLAETKSILHTLGALFKVVQKYGGRNSTTAGAEKVSRFQPLSPNPSCSWLV